MTAQMLHQQGLLQVQVFDWEETAQLHAYVTPSTRLCVCAAVCNETGVVLPVPLITTQVKHVNPDVHVHVDAVQALGKTPVDVSAWGCDSVGLSAHKTGALPGVGVLWVRHPSFLESFLRESFWGLFSNPPAEAAWAESLLQVPSFDPSLRDGFEAALKQQMPCLVTVLGEAWPRVSHVSCVRFHGHQAESLVIALDMHGFAVSAGSACSSGATEPSATLLALGFSRQEALQTVRFSFGPYTSIKDIEALCVCLQGLLQQK
jgi:cysteine desulfurase